jgi:ferrochelatase
MATSKTLPDQAPAAAPAEHPPIATGRVGVLLVNLGTPDAPEPGAVRRYLREFLSDRRVVDYPRAAWLPVLYGIILNARPRKTAALYRSIWHAESGQSPLRHHTERQSAALDEALNTPRVVTDWAMRYGTPSIPSRLAALQAAGCERILVVPLYPQYSATTTATVVDSVGAWLGRQNWQPTLRFSPPFHDEPAYIDSLAAVAAQHVTTETERVILSFHGIPERYFRNGDPYHCHCQKTARLLRERLGWTADFAPIGFQSKFGPEKWLAPATEDLVREAAADGLKKIAVIAPAFVADCIETLEEIGIGLAETFHAAGGDTLVPIPCLNDDETFVTFLANFVKRELGGWI